MSDTIRQYTHATVLISKDVIFGAASLDEPTLYIVSAVGAGPADFPEQLVDFFRTSGATISTGAADTLWISRNVVTALGEPAVVIQTDRADEWKAVLKGGFH